MGLTILTSPDSHWKEENVSATKSQAIFKSHSSFYQVQCPVLQLTYFQIISYMLSFICIYIYMSIICRLSFCQICKIFFVLPGVLSTNRAKSSKKTPTNQTNQKNPKSSAIEWGIYIFPM